MKIVDILLKLRTEGGEEARREIESAAKAGEGTASGPGVSGVSTPNLPPPPPLPPVPERGEEEADRYGGLPPPPPLPLSLQTYLGAEQYESFVLDPKGFSEAQPNAIKALPSKLAGAARRYAAYGAQYFDEGVPPEGFEPDVYDDLSAPHEGGRRPGSDERRGRLRGYAAPIVGGALALAGVGSVMGFLTASASQYQQVADTLKVLERRFGDVGEAAMRMGHTVGYVAQESAALMNAYGAQAGTMTGTRFLSLAGVSRVTGMELPSVGSIFGTLSRFSGDRMLSPSGQQVSRAVEQGMSPRTPGSDVAIRDMLALSRRMGMAGARYEEQLQAFAEAARQQYGVTTEEANAGAFFGGGVLAHEIFGNTPMGQGQMGLEFGRKAGALMGGETSKAMQIYMMRAIGFGSQGGPSYLDAMERLEAGAFDPRNAADLFRALRSDVRGLSPEEAEARTTMRLMSEAKAAGMTVSQLRKFVHFGLSERGIKTLERYAENPESIFEGDLTKEEQEILRVGGFKVAGRSQATAADWNQVATQQMMVGVGRDVTMTMTNLKEAASDVADMFVKLFKVNPAKVMVEASKSIKEFTHSINESKITIDAVRETVETPGESWWTGVKYLKRTALENWQQATGELDRQMRFNPVAGAGE